MTLQKWIVENHLQVNFLSDKILEIAEVGKFLILDTDKQDFVFDTSFVLNLTDEEIDLIDAVDYILFKFGSFWFYHHKDVETELNFFRYLGKQWESSLSQQTAFLGVHGKYELSNGTREYADWIKKLKFAGYTHAGLCEYQTLASAFYFKDACAKYGITPLYGRECIIQDNVGDKITIKAFAKTRLGWQNLLKIHNQECIERYLGGRYISEEEFVQWREDLFIILPTATPLDKVHWDIFDLNNTFYQFDPKSYISNTADQTHLQHLQTYLTSYFDKIEPIIFQDAYYLDQGDEVSKKLVNSIGRSTRQYQSQDEYVKPFDVILEEVLQLFAGPNQNIEDAFRHAKVEDLVNRSFINHERFLNECNYRLEKEGMHLPKYKMNAEEAVLYTDNEDMFFDLVMKGFEKRVVGKVNGREQEYVERLEREIAVLQEGKVVDYFLILYDVFNFLQRGTGIVSLGRGSAAGCLVSYLLGIVQIDPIEYNLLFERFLNKARLLTGALPDIDSDIPSSFRSQVIDYLIDKYGRKNVTNIGTAQNLQLKSAFKDLLRQKGYDHKTMNLLTSFFTTEDNLGGLKELFLVAQREPKIREVIEEHPEIVYETYLLLQQPRSFGMHAAGIVIFPDRDEEGNVTIAADFAPLRYSGELLVSEWEKEAVEGNGLLKADLLGLAQLDKIRRMNELILENGKTPPEFSTIALDDQKVFELFRSAVTEDIFQFNTDVQKSYLLQLQPEHIEDLIAANALNRPGAMESNSHNDFIKIKNGEIEAKYPPLLEDLLAPTKSMWCVSGDARITTDQGLISLKDVQEGQKVLTEDGSYQTVLTNTYMGAKSVYEVRTNFGDPLYATGDHQVLTNNGWKRVDELQQGYDHIKAFWLNQQSTYPIGTEKDWLLGHYLADGAQTVFYTASEDFANKLAEIVRRNFTLDNVHVKYTNTCWRVTCSNQKGGFTHSNAWLEFIRLYHLEDCVSYNKFIPTQAYTLQTVIGFIEGDGNVNNGTITIVNRKLAEQLLDILQNFNIRSSIDYLEGEKTRIHFDATNPLLQYKIKTSRVRQHASNVINVPFDTLTREQIAHLRSTYSDSSKTASAYICASKKRNWINLQVADRCSIDVPHKEWAFIKSIKADVRVEDVYDLSIENIHSFVAGGLVVHNCYQEQAMLAYQRISDCDLQETDKFRKVISKSKPGKIDPDIEKYKESFLAGYEVKGVNREIASAVWTNIVGFSSYSFNRSHAAAYAITGYWAAHYKAYFPVEFYTSSLEFATKHSKYEVLLPRLISEITSSQLATLYPPDINKSDVHYTMDAQSNAIYWSLTSVKQLGEKAAANILAERQANGDFFALDEFVERMKGKRIGKLIITNAILSGCFDEMMYVTEPKDRLRVLQQFYDMIKEKPPIDIVTHPHVNKNHFWIMQQKRLCNLGSIDYQTLFRHERITKWVAVPFCDSYLLQEATQVGKRVAIGGILEELIERKTRGGDVMASLKLNSNDVSITITLWPNHYKNFKETLHINMHQPILLDGMVEYDDYRRKNILKSTESTYITGIK